METTQFRAGILTPYLTGEVIKRHKDNSTGLSMHVDKYGAQDMSDSLEGFEELEQGVYRKKAGIDIVLDLRHRDTDEDIVRQMLLSADLAIVGCTPSEESSVDKCRATGLPFARCSMFYGGPSGYTDLYPEETSYSFDLPKDKTLVFSFLTNESIASAILERNPDRIRRSCDEFNLRSNYAPVIVTSYLDEVCKIPLEERTLRLNTILDSKKRGYA